MSRRFRSTRWVADKINVGNGTPRMLSDRRRGGADPLRNLSVKTGADSLVAQRVKSVNAGNDSFITLANFSNAEPFMFMM